MRAVPLAYLELMLHWKQGVAVFAQYVGNLPGRIKWARQRIDLCYAELDRIPVAQRDSMDYQAMADCTLMGEWLTKRLRELTQSDK